MGPEAITIDINQVNIVEHSAQVAVMSNNYRGAECVKAWLGEDTRDSERVFGLLKEMTRAAEQGGYFSKSSDSKEKEDGL
jgi:hypothetical protein